MEMKGIMGSLFKSSEWIMKFLIINIIWLLFNFPIVYLLLNTLFIQSENSLVTIMILILILLPFVFFPATTAMFASVRRGIVGTNQGKPLYYYWRCYKENYFRSLQGGFFYTTLWVVWILNYHLSGAELGSGLFYFYLAGTLFIVAFTNYFFADTVHFEVKFFSSIKKALFMAVFYLHFTLGSAGALGIAVFVLYLIHPALLLLFSGSIIAYIYFFAFHQIYLKAEEAINSPVNHG